MQTSEDEPTQYNRTTTTEKPEEGRAPSEQLYRDALHALFAFLTLRELVSAGRTCQSWYAAALSPRVRACAHKLSGASEVAVCSLRFSPLRRHIEAIDSGFKPADKQATYKVETLAVLRAFLPHLTSLRVRVDLTIDGPSLVLPAGLRSLDLALQIEEHLAMGTALQIIVASVESIASEAPLLTRVSLQLCGHDLDTFSDAMLQPLPRLSQLTDLEVELQQDDQAAIHVLRSMRGLRRLNPGRSLTEDALAWLTAGEQPMPMLEELVLVPSEYTIISEVVPLLARLPSLTKLHPYSFRVADPGVLLSQLPRLVSLGMCCEQSVGIDLCLAAFAHCSQLISLSLSHELLTDTHLCALLPRLPQLSELELLGCGRLVSLRCLSQTAHLARTLHSLTLDECKTVPAFELSHLRRLTSLTSLVIKSSLSDRLDSLSVHSFQPDSPHFAATFWPRLTHFEYE